MQRVSSSGFWILTLRLRFWICLCSPFSALFHVNPTEIKIQLWIDSSQEVNQTRCGLINWIKGQRCRYVLGILDKQKEKRNSILDVRHELVETRYRYKYWIIYSAPVPRAWVIFVRFLHALVGLRGHFQPYARLGHFYCAWNQTKPNSKLNQKESMWLRVKLDKETDLKIATS